jgi:hypothetical protein
MSVGFSKIADKMSVDFIIDGLLAYREVRRQALKPADKVHGEARLL